MHHCVSCESDVETQYDCPDCGDEYCAECRAPINHDCPQNQPEPEPAPSQPGRVKQNAGWIFALLVGIGQVASGGIVTAGPVQMLASVGGLAVGVLVLGVVGQYINRWNVSKPEPTTA